MHFFVTIPLANQYLQLFNEGIGINLWTLSSYLDYTVALLLANAFGFEGAVILLFLVHFGILSADAMINKRAACDCCRFHSWSYIDATGCPHPANARRSFNRPL